GIERTNDMPLTGLAGNQLRVDFRDARPHVDLGDDEIASIERKGRGPEKLAGIAVESPDAAALTDVDRDVSHLPAGNVRIDPFHKFRIGIDHCPNECSLFVDVLVPVVA